MYKVRLTSTALRAFNRLPEKVRGAVAETIRGPLAERPHVVGKPLLYELAGLHCVRRGDYRVIYQILDEAAEVRVHLIDHRRDVYRSR